MLCERVELRGHLLALLSHGSQLPHCPVSLTCHRTQLGLLADGYRLNSVFVLKPTLTVTINIASSLTIYTVQELSHFLQNYYFPFFKLPFTVPTHPFSCGQQQSLKAKAAQATHYTKDNFPYHAHTITTNTLLTPSLLSYSTTP